MILLIQRRRTGENMGIMAAALAAKDAQDALEREQEKIAQRKHAEAAEHAVWEVTGLRGRCVKAFMTEPVSTATARTGWGDGAVVVVEDSDEGLEIGFGVAVNDIGTRTTDIYGNVVGEGRLVTTVRVRAINGSVPMIFVASELAVASLADLGRILEKHYAALERKRERQLDRG
jgi:hypothetical protein